MYINFYKHMRTGIIFMINALNSNSKSVYKKYLFKLNIEAKLYEKPLFNFHIHFYFM